jgi:cyanophycin synthetase
MRILHIKVLDGPNYWSVHSTQLIEMKLDIGLYEHYSSIQLAGFNDRLLATLPGLSKHCYASGQEGGFVEKLKQGIWLGHVTERVAIELQVLSGMACSFGRTRSTGEPGTYHIVFSYLLPKAGVYAARAAVNLVTALAGRKPYLLEETSYNLRQIYEHEKLGAGIQAIVNEALRRGIPYTRLGEDAVVMLGNGCLQRKVCAGMVETTSAMGIALASGKQQSIGIMAAAGIPVPESEIVGNEADLFHVVQEWGYPVVIKPAGVSVWSWKKAKAAFIRAGAVYKEITVEKYVAGIVYQLLVINYRVVAIVMVDGTVADVTDKAHPANIFIAERAARLIGLNICCVKVICRDITLPLEETGGVVLDVIAGSDADVYIRHVAGAIMDMLFPADAGTCIPVVAVTGTHGTAVITGIIAHIAMKTGLYTGYTTTEGIYCNGYLVKKGNYNELSNARVVLTDPQVQYAVLGCTSAGIWNAGLGFSQCRISVVANIAADHLDRHGIRTIEQLAAVKQVVAASTMGDGHAVLNADDDLVYDMKKALHCHIALYSHEQVSPRITAHYDSGGLCAFVQDGWIMVGCSGKVQQVLPIEELAVTLDGSVMAAVLVAVISDFPVENIAEILKCHRCCRL